MSAANWGFWSADCKRGWRKGARAKIVKKCQKVFRHFSSIFARHLFSGPFWAGGKNFFAGPKCPPKNVMISNRVVVSTGDWPREEGLLASSCEPRQREGGGLLCMRLGGHIENWAAVFLKLL